MAWIIAWLQSVCRNLTNLLDMQEDSDGGKNDDTIEWGDEGTRLIGDGRHFFMVICIRQ